MANVALLMPLYDPRGVLVEEVERVRNDPAASGAWRALRAQLGQAVALAEPGGSPATREAFAALGVDVRLRSPRSHFMWALVEAALELEAEYFFLPDSDRLLHWLLAYPDELAELPARWGCHDVLSLSRSERAFASHPPTQRLTEGPAMALVARAIDLVGADPFSGAYLMSRRALTALAASEAPRDECIYAEAFLAPARAGCSFGRWVVEGLEWETPDHFRAEIAARGREAWLADFQSPAQWEMRARMLAGWIDRIIAHENEVLRSRDAYSRRGAGASAAPRALRADARRGRRGH